MPLRSGCFIGIPGSFRCLGRVEVLDVFEGEELLLFFVSHRMSVIIIDLTLKQFGQVAFSKSNLISLIQEAVCWPTDVTLHLTHLKKTARHRYLSNSITVPIQLLTKSSVILGYPISAAKGKHLLLFGSPPIIPDCLCPQAVNPNSSVDRGRLVTK